MKYKNNQILLMGLLFFVSNTLLGQINISGFVKDSQNGEVLVGAYVQDSATGKVESTNVNGYFSLSAITNCHLSVSYVGYEKKIVLLKITTDTILTIFLNAGTELSEVVVKAQQCRQFYTSTLSVKELKKIPSLGGSPDLLKAMQLLPGIQGQSESSSLLVVRGGDPGQNLYLLDNTPLIYINHLGGFMSVFNAEMINNISVYKGGFPSEYGGKLSSIMSITQRAGDTSGIKGTFGIGLADINGSIEGPLGKKGSFIVTGRKTLFGALLNAASSISDGNDYTITYGFHDINGKVTWAANHKNKFSFNVYQGDDYLNWRSKSNTFYPIPKTHLKNVWGNWLAGVNWNYLASPKLFAETGLSYTRYRLKETQKLSETDASDFNDKSISSVDDFTLRTTWKYAYLAWWKLNYGVNSSFTIHTPYSYEISGVSNEKSKISVNALQTSLFLENEIKPFKLLSFTIGGRVVNYQTKGLNDFAFEPRMGINYKVMPNHKLNLSYMQVNQYSHLLFNTGNIASSEVWIPATKDIPAAWSEQTSAGWQANYFNDLWSSEVSVYYKTMNNLSTYRSGEINLKDDAAWESNIESGGKGESYGFEVFAKKNYGNWTGNIGYCWSKTTRQYPVINGGLPYLFEYNRPHSISLFLSRKISDKWDFNMVWVYQTGLPYTPVVGRQYTPSFEPNGQVEPFYYEALIYGERNSGRLPDYHRLDVGFNYTKQTKNGNKAVWNFSIYNLYNRQNPNYFYYNNNATDEIVKPEMGDAYKPLDMYSMSIFPILPSVSYKVYFDGKNQTQQKKAKRNIFRNLLYFEE